MKKFFLVVFIFVDLMVIAASVLFLVARFTHKMPSGIQVIPTAQPMARPMTSSAPAPSPMPLAGIAKPGLPTASGVPATHKMLFTYHNSRAKVVMIRADFTGWKAEPMQKGPGNKWTYVAQLEPGEYAYVFSVDNRSIRDPVNKHVKQVGKTYVSSVVVKPAAAPALGLPAPH